MQINLKKNNKSFISYLLIFIILIGGFLRVKMYLMGRPLWHDECSLALSLLHRGLFGYFVSLEHFQCAPPLFMSAVKLFTIFGGVNEYSLRFVPLVASLLALPLFYFFSNEVFKNKFTVLAANLLFAINSRLIYYSSEFKQYSTDIFFVILTLLILPRINLLNMSFKKLLLFSILMPVVIFCSFPACFVFAGYFFLQLLEHKLKILGRIVLISIPQIILSIIYYFYNVENTYSQQMTSGMYQWENGFLAFNVKSLVNFFKTNFNYWFEPNYMILFGIILFVFGVLIFARRNNFSKLVLFTFLFALCASSLKLYPIYQRVGLFLLPLCILLICAAIDKIFEMKKVYSVLVLLIFAAYFSGYSLNYFKTIYTRISPQENAKLAMETISNNIKSGEVFVFNDASNSEYVFYSHYYNFTPEKFVKITAINNSYQEYLLTLNLLPSGIYWFYYPFEYARMPVTKLLKEWSRNHDVLFEQKIGISYVLKLKIGD